MKNEEMFDIEELERIASDDSIRIPENLGEELSGMIDSLDAAENILVSKGWAGRRLWTYMAGAAASVAIIVGTGMAVFNVPSPEDTFDDPALAYAEVEKALLFISEKMNQGVERASSAERSIERQTAVLNDLYVRNIE